jgi:hypothetical protein
VFQEIFAKYQGNILKENLRLSALNLIIFPDWGQPEELLLQELVSVIRAIATHPDKSKMTLLVDSSNVSDDDANLILSSVAMNLLMEEDLDVSDGPEISLVGQLSKIQWQALMSHLQGKIVLKQENTEVSRPTGFEKIPSYRLESFTNM